MRTWSTLFKDFRNTIFGYLSIKQRKSGEDENYQLSASDIDLLLVPDDELKKARKDHLNGVKAIANQFLNENLAIKDKHKAQWEGKTIEMNIASLKEVIRKANKDLEEPAIENYILEVKKTQTALLQQKSFIGLPDIQRTLVSMTLSASYFDVYRYSPGYSITYDLHWIVHGTVGEKMDVTTGKKPPDLYEKFCPELLTKINESVIPMLRSKPRYALTSKVLEDACKGFEKNSFVVSNILFITIIESLVRELARFVYGKQNVSKSEEEVELYITGHQSLENLILKADWKDDIEMGVIDAYMLSQNVSDVSLDRAAEIIGRSKSATGKIKVKLDELILILSSANAETSEAEQQQVLEKLKELEHITGDILQHGSKMLISFRSKLLFLGAEIKEDRNSIIHGNYFEFDKGWKAFIYLSAIVKVVDLIKEYDTVYNEPVRG